MINNIFERDYKHLLMECLLNGELTDNRTGVKTYKLFNKTFNIDLQKGFPIVTAKKINFSFGLHEFLWIFNGRTDLAYLNEHGIKWWDDFAKNGKLGKVYGYQLRKFGGDFDQVEYVINEIKNNSRRAVISLWNPNDLKEQALPCCYTHFNFVRAGNNLSMSMDFRSSDMFLGLPYDIIVGALLLTTIAKECELTPSRLGINLKDAHIYENHKEQVIKYNRAETHVLPTLTGDIEEYELDNYTHNKYIKAKLNK